MNLAPGIDFSLPRTRHKHIPVGSDAAIPAAYGPGQTEVDSFGVVVYQGIYSLRSLTNIISVEY